MNVFYCLLCFLICLSDYIPGVAQQLFIQKYPIEVYHGSSQNWDMTQDEQGILYFANSDAVLIFDGLHWEQITLPNNAYVLSVFANMHGKVYVGASGEFGYIAKNTKGDYQYFSLTASLADEVRNNLADIWDLRVVNNTVVFGGDNGYLFVYDNGKSKILLDNLDDWRPRLIELNGTIYYIKDNLLYRYANGALHSTEYHLPAGLMQRNQTGRYILLDEKKQLWKLDATKPDQSVMTPISNGFNATLKNLDVVSILLLSDGRLAVLTTEEILILNSHGDIEYKVTGDLLGNSILTELIFFEDAQHNLWFATEEFIGTIITSSPLAYYDKLNGIKGSVIVMGSHSGQKYIGTTKGLFHMTSKDRFEFVTSGAVWNMYTLNGHFYMVNDYGVYEVINHQAHLLVEQRLALSLCAVAQHPDRMIMGTYDAGLWLLTKKDGIWSRRRIRGFEEETKLIQEDENGNFWIAHYGKGIWKLQLNNTMDSVVGKKFYGALHNLPSHVNNRIHKLRDHTILVTTQNGIYRYNALKDIFEPDPRFRKALEGIQVYSLTEGPDENIYIRGKKNIAGGTEQFTGLLKKEADNTYSLFSTPFNKIPWMDIEPCLLTVQDEVWIGNNSHVIVYRPLKKTYYQEIPQLVIKKVTAADSVISINNTARKKLILPYNRNNLRFDFSGSFYEEADKNEFQYKLIGFDKDWSPWTTSQEAHFTNLPEGDYTFTVRLRNVYKQESKPAVFSFHILPPIYRTVWAYLVYAGLLGLLVYGLTILRTKRVNRQKAMLELQVYEKTQELLAMNEEIITQNDEISHINEELNLKNTEIEKQSEILRQSNYTKDKLFSIISHDLRGPINQFRSILDLFESGYISENEFQKNLMPDLKDRIHYVATLIDNLLHWAKDQMEGIQVKPGVFDLPQVIHETVNLLRPQAQRKSITLGLDIAPSLQVYGDKDMIKLVLRNLISNAIKFTPQKGAIAITTRNENEYIYIAVADTGTGLSPEEIHRIQDKEYFTKYGTAGEKGSGLGLMLCREFVEKNGGQLFIESKPDIGSTFTFSLPYGDKGKALFCAKD